MKVDELVVGEVKEVVKSGDERDGRWRDEGGEREGKSPGMGGGV